MRTGISTLMSLLAAFAVAVLIDPTPAVAAKKKPEICTAIFLPVCALKKDKTRSTFSNACWARAEGAKVLHVGACFGPICLEVYDPVCARDPRGFPRTYGNLCKAENANAVFLRNGTCK